MNATKQQENVIEVDLNEVIQPGLHIGDYAKSIENKIMGLVREFEVAEKEAKLIIDMSHFSEISLPPYRSIDIVRALHSCNDYFNGVEIKIREDLLNAPVFGPDTRTLKNCLDNCLAEMVSYDTIPVFNVKKYLENGWKDSMVKDLEKKGIYRDNIQIIDGLEPSNVSIFDLEGADLVNSIEDLSYLLGISRRFFRYTFVENIPLNLEDVPYGDVTYKQHLEEVHSLKE